MYLDVLCMMAHPDDAEILAVLTLEGGADELSDLPRISDRSLPEGPARAGGVTDRHEMEGGDDTLGLCLGGPERLQPALRSLSEPLTAWVGGGDLLRRLGAHAG